MDSFVVVSAGAIAALSMTGILLVRAAIRRGDRQAEANTSALLRALEADASPRSTANPGPKSEPTGAPS